jgi:glycogen debranching enzyme
VQWHDGRLAVGPIALCEVQGYAYEAAIGGAQILEAFGFEGEAREWRSWAAALKAPFRDAFWIGGGEAASGDAVGGGDAAVGGTVGGGAVVRGVDASSAVARGGGYPAIALDGEKRAVDAVTSNMGHLLGTGILDAADEAAIADRLLAADMCSGYGLRTLSSGARGYWPLSYHGGSVWTHDTAIAVFGMQRCGMRDRAQQLVEGMLAAAEGFSYHVPELHGGWSASETPTPIPYPAACHPQAWSAGAAFVALAAELGLQPDRERRRAVVQPAPWAGHIRVNGVKWGESEQTVAV